MDPKVPSGLFQKKRVAIVQSNYIPWKGYFDLINSVDEFIIYDDMQYTRRDWRNRNKIKTSNGSIWLTIPVLVKGKYFQKIKETQISDPNWYKNHWNSLKHNYSRARYFKYYESRIIEMYMASPETYLSQLNYRFIKTICDLLNIKTKISWSADYNVIDGKTERLVEICRQAGATEYFSGPSARDYIIPELFARAGIQLIWMDYSGYREYEQLYPPFDHFVSIVDLLFNTGPDARSFLKT